MGGRSGSGRLCLETQNASHYPPVWTQSGTQRENGRLVGGERHEQIAFVGKRQGREQIVLVGERQEQIVAHLLTSMRGAARALVFAAAVALPPPPVPLSRWPPLPPRLRGTHGH